MNPALVPAIRAESLVKSFSTDWRGRRLRALDGVDFIISRGAVGGLIGPNGSGKTTTLKILAGLNRPDGGRAEILGVGAADARRRGQLGYLPASPALPAHLGGEEFLLELGRLTGVSTASARNDARRALECAGLSAEGNRRIGGYSSGMRQRLGLAAAILHDPEVILLDEPVAGMDPRATAQFGRIVTELARQGRTILFSSHFLSQVEELCDVIVLLDRGRVLHCGPRKEAVAAGGLHRIFLEMTSA